MGVNAEGIPRVCQGGPPDDPRILGIPTISLSFQ